jgi:hypothetical protein
MGLKTAKTALETVFFIDFRGGQKMKKPPVFGQFCL